MDLSKTQHRIWKDVDYRALKIDDSFVTNEWQIFPWMFFPTNLFQTWDLIMFRHQFRRYVEHLFECEICRVHTMEFWLFWQFFLMNTAYSIVTAINIHQIIECSSPSPVTLEFFLSFPRLIIHPIYKWSWFYRQFQFCFIGSHDGLLRICHFLRIDIIRSPWSGTKCFFVPYGLCVPSRRISSWPGRTSRIIFQEVSSGRPDRSYVLISVFHSWEDQARSSSHFE